MIKLNISAINTIGGLGALWGGPYRYCSDTLPRKTLNSRSRTSPNPRVLSETGGVLSTWVTCRLRNPEIMGDLTD